MKKLQRMLRIFVFGWCCLLAVVFEAMIVLVATMVWTLVAGHHYKPEDTIFASFVSVMLLTLLALIPSMAWTTLPDIKRWAFDERV